MDTPFPGILTDPSTSLSQLNSSGCIDVRKYMWQEALHRFFQTQPCLVKRINTGCCTYLRTNLKCTCPQRGLLFPLKSPWPICFQKDLPCYTEPKCKYLPLNFAARSGQRANVLPALQRTCPTIRSLLSDFIDATAFTVTTKASVIGASLVSKNV